MTIAEGRVITVQDILGHDTNINALLSHAGSYMISSLVSAENPHGQPGSPIFPIRMLATASGQSSKVIEASCSNRLIISCIQLKKGYTTDSDAFAIQKYHTYGHLINPITMVGAPGEIPFGQLRTSTYTSWQAQVSGQQFKNPLLVNIFETGAVGSTLDALGINERLILAKASSHYPIWSFEKDVSDDSLDIYFDEDSLYDTNEPVLAAQGFLLALPTTMGGEPGGYEGNNLFRGESCTFVSGTTFTTPVAYQAGTLVVYEANGGSPEILERFAPSRITETAPATGTFDVTGVVDTDKVYADFVGFVGSIS